MNNQNEKKMPDHRNNHAAIHEDIYLERGRKSSNPDEKSEEEANPVTLWNGVVVIAGKGHPGYL